MLKLAAVPFRWRQEQERRQAEKARNLAKDAAVTVSSTDLVNKVYAPQHAVDGRQHVGAQQLGFVEQGHLANVAVRFGRPIGSYLFSLQLPKG